MSNRLAHKGIVVGVDGSSSSMQAVRWAAHEAEMRNVPLSLIHVIDTPPSGLLALGGAVLPPRTETEDWQKTESAKIISDAGKAALEQRRQRSPSETAVGEVWYPPIWFRR